MSEEWEIIFYQEVDGTVPVQEFFLDPSLTQGEKKQFEVRLNYLRTRGLSLLRERSDILDKIETEENLYELRLDNTPNNPRIFLCALKGKKCLVLLCAFKKKSRRTPQREIQIAVRLRELIVAKEESNDTEPTSW